MALELDHVGVTRLNLHLDVRWAGICGAKATPSQRKTARKNRVGFFIHFALKNTLSTCRPVDSMQKKEYSLHGPHTSQLLR
jgi:hypothetical protein